MESDFLDSLGYCFCLHCCKVCNGSKTGFFSTALGSLIISLLSESRMLFLALKIVCTNLLRWIFFFFLLCNMQSSLPFHNKPFKTIGNLQCL